MWLPLRMSVADSCDCNTRYPEKKSTLSNSHRRTSLKYYYNEAEAKLSNSLLLLGKKNYSFCNKKKCAIKAII